MLASCARLADRGRIAEMALKAALIVRPEILVQWERPSVHLVPLVLLAVRELRHVRTALLPIPVMQGLPIAISVLLVLFILRELGCVQSAALALTALQQARRAALIAKLVRTTLTRPHQNALLALQAFTVEPELVAALAVFLVLTVVLEPPAARNVDLTGLVWVALLAVQSARIILLV